MKLYSIRHKISGKFLVNYHPACGEQWAEKPKFWSTIDGIKSNLMKISGEQVHCDWHDRKGFVFSGPYRVKWINSDPSKLEHIEVIVTNVSVLGEESFPASSFILEKEKAA